MKKTALLIIGLFLATAVTAQVVETTTYDDGRVYTGQRNGKGKIEGKGLMTWPNGDRYDGMWKKGLMDGEGTYTYATAGYSYSGQWSKGFIKGHGTFRFNNGNVMEGDWTAMGTGTGYLVFADGTRYDGPFVNGAPHGQGIKVWANGDRYEGQFVMGHMTGQGSIKFADGATYTGTWLNDHRDGQGVATYPDGGRYEGGWKNDQYDGQGTHTSPDGTVLSGRFVNGKLAE
jgi:hypothetical protein